KRSAVYLMIRASGERSQVVNALEHHAKAGASDVIETLVSRAIEGVPLEYREAPPPGIPIYQNGYCFLIDRMHPAWEEVERKGVFCLYWDEAPEDAAAEMIIARR
ncbi:MAG: type VI secretion system baseplate subunit TssK, partial [Chlorobiales bacterium]|nr:type VI secretion system baseplate subunit TssK [Chlorobiales bacterium]